MSYADARALHDEVATIDLHADTPKIMHAFGYDLSVRHEPPLPGARYLGHVDAPRMREGGLAAQFFGLWTFPYPRRGCRASVLRQLDMLDQAVSHHPEELSWCRSPEDIAQARTAGQIAVLAGIEGGQALEGSVDGLDELARRGVRYMGLLHFTANDLGRPAWGVGSDDGQGLTPFGRDVIAEMNRLGIILDLAHINRRGFFEALECSHDAPIISHTGVSGVTPHWRNVDDEQLRAIAERGGVVGIIFALMYLGADGLDALAAHFHHVVKIAGEDTPALGSDFDGMIKPVRGLEDVSMLPRLTATLLRTGLSRRAVRKILGQNVMRVLGDVPARVASRG